MNSGRPFHLLGLSCNPFYPHCSFGTRSLTLAFASSWQGQKQRQISIKPVPEALVVRNILMPRSDDYSFDCQSVTTRATLASALAL